MDYNSEMNRNEYADYVINSLEGFPFLKVTNKHLSQNSAYDLMLLLLSQDRKKKFKENSLIYAQFLKSGQPRSVRRGIHLLGYKIKDSTDYGLLVAPYFSENSRQIIKEAGYGYMDLAGNYEINCPPVYLRSVGNKNQSQQKRELRSIFSSKGERVVRTLLGAGKVIWEIKDLAEKSQVSLGHASNIKRRLQEKEYLTVEEPSGFRITNPFDLLNDWKMSYQIKKHRKFKLYGLQKPHEMEADLTRVFRKLKIKYAFTGFSAAIRYHAHVRYKKVSLYAEKMPENLDQIGLKEVDSGSNCEIYIPYDNGILSNDWKDNDESLVTAEQLYLDLLQMKSRGEEAATEIMKRCIEIKW